MLGALLSPEQASAQDYRAGRFFPVRASELETIDRSGVVPTVVPDHAQTPDTILPILAIHDLAVPARALQQDERLVGVATPDSSLAAELFPGRKIIDVRIDFGN